MLRDSRVSGEWIERISAGVLQSMGANVLSCGIQPTPTAQLLALQRSNAVGALVITSSHNPKEWNVCRCTCLFSFVLETYFSVRDSNSLTLTGYS